MLPNLPTRRRESHKGDFGRVLAVAGSRGMSGAAALVGMAALRSGSGLVTVATAADCLDAVAGFDPSLMTLPLPCDRTGAITLTAKERIAAQAKTADSLAVGPGLGRSAALSALVTWMHETLTMPIVLDADGLNALASRPEAMPRAGGPRVFTPHPGEFRRLIGDGNVRADDMPARAEELARATGAVIVLKGSRTLVTDGTISERNETGNPGMATGGTGDVLTGVIASLVGQGLSPFDAARLGVHVHGLAGDLAADRLGQAGMTSHDLLEQLPAAFMTIR